MKPQASEMKLQASEMKSDMKSGMKSLLLPRLALSCAKSGMKSLLLPRRLALSCADSAWSAASQKVLRRCSALKW